MNSTNTARNQTPGWRSLTLAKNGETAAIATSLINLGHAMGLTVTAEGVETPEQMKMLFEIGLNEL